MAEQDIFKIKKEYNDFFAFNKQLIEDITNFIAAAKAQLPQLVVGSLTYYKIKIEIADNETRLKTLKEYMKSHLWSFNEIFMPEYKKQIEDYDKNFDVVYNKAKTIIEKNDTKAKNFELLKKVLDDYSNPENEMSIKLLLFKALQSLL